MKPWAYFSPCERYRYVLTWPTGYIYEPGFVPDERYALFVLANPSTATAEQTDPTVSRCIAYARRWGFGWCRVVNVRAWRETDPRKLPADPLAISDPEAPNWNDTVIQQQAVGATIVVCGWGKLAGERGPHVLSLLRDAGVTPHALKVNKDGSPAHPLYLRADALPFPMKEGT
jgi:hypothetical protein